MSGITNLTASHTPPISQQDAVGQKPKMDAQAVAVAKQAMNQAQGRVDADRRAHSPSCVAVDQKGVDKASADLAHVKAEENAVTAGSKALSISV